MVPHIKEIELPNYPEKKTIYMDLDSYNKNFMHAYYNFKRKKYLNTYSDIVNYEDVMAESGLSCSWCRN